MLEIKKCIMALQIIIIGIESAKILSCFPSSSFSHQMVFRAITRELLKRGHKVTVITTNPLYPKRSSPDNLTEINVHHASYNIFTNYYKRSITGKKSDVFREVKIGQNVITMVFEQIVQLEGISNLLEYQKDDFDLFLLEAVYTPFLGFTHIFKVPTILVSSFGSFPGIYDMVGAPTHPTLYSNFYSSKIYNLTLWEKVTETFKYLRINNIISNIEEKTNELLKKLLGPDTPPLKKLKDNVDMLFLNVNPIWNDNHPVPTNVVYMGGIHQTPPKFLPQDLQHYLDRSDNGVIYFSLGTNVNTSFLTINTVTMFRKVFTQLPYNIIWKWDSDKFPVKSKNIKMINWLPQADLLRHKNVKMFITQGGLQSIDEAITAGVPLIGIPMLADQWQNLEKCVHHKIGIGLDFETLSEEKLRKAIIEVAETESYRNNIIRLRSLMQDQPQNPLDRTIWWIEYVLRHGGAKHLRAPAANLSWTDFLEFKLVGIITFLIFISIFVIFLAVRYLIPYVLRVFMSKTKLKKT